MHEGLYIILRVHAVDVWRALEEHGETAMAWIYPSQAWTAEKTYSCSHIHALTHPHTDAFAGHAAYCHTLAYNKLCESSCHFFRQVITRNDTGNAGHKDSTGAE